MKPKRLETLGIWIGSPSRLPSLQREGIFRFLFNLVKHLMLSHPLRIEVWCQELNLPAVRELFSELSDSPQFRERIIFCTERNGGGQLPGKPGYGRHFFLRLGAAIAHDLKTGIFFLQDVCKKSKRLLLPAAVSAAVVVIFLFFHFQLMARMPFGIYFFPLLAFLLVSILVFRDRLEWPLIWAWDFFKQASNSLPQVANQYSTADCFLVQNIDMANALKLDRLKVINLHDLFTSEFARLFRNSGRARRLLFQGQKAARYASRLARDGSFFVSNSDHIRRTHALALIPGLGEENTDVIFLPAIIPEGIRQKLLERQAALAAFTIHGDYIFYPSHIRPYKNILTLLKAFKIVLDRGHELSLVLTGNLADDSECLAFARMNGLEKNIILTGEISEVEMYGLYRYASLVAVPTLAESSFPWQALEAMAMEVPVIISRIPVVEERLRFHGLAADTCGLLMFEPLDEAALARMIIQVLIQRAHVLSEQRTLRKTLLAYDWHQLSDRYYSLFTRLLERPHGPPEGDPRDLEHEFPIEGCLS
jgi:glycosyltransferase involved in cell wall biosynthesis